VYDFASETEVSAVSIALGVVCDVARDKKFDPVKQIPGYILSGDATFIPRDRNARDTLKKLDRNEILEELVEAYLQKEGKI